MPELTLTSALDDNDSVFRRLLGNAESRLSDGSAGGAAWQAEAAALFATWHHTGYFASAQLERLLLSAAQDLAGRQARQPGPPYLLPHRILHVATWSRPLGGLSRLVERWIGNDPERCHSVALTRQTVSDVPVGLREAVKATGGSIHRLDLCPGGYRGQVRRLQALARGADLVIVHVETEDVVPAIAFHDHAGPPVAFVNHADHAFWVGAAACDVVINLRQSGARLSAMRRGVVEERNLVLPTPLASVRRQSSRQEAKQRLGLPPDGVLLISVARAPKFVAKEGLHFVDLHVPALETDGRVYLYAVGAQSDRVWQTARQRFGARVRAVDETPDTALFLQAADIYVDSFPFTSITSMLEAGLWGLPLMTFSPYGPESAILGPDAPGLDDALIRAGTVDAYGEALVRLASDRLHREQLADRTRHHIEELHTGEGWRHRLTEIYAHLVSLGSAPPNRVLDMPRSTGEPDIYVPAVFGADLDLGAYLERRLAVLPTRSRFIEWKRLRRDEHVGLRALVPESVRAARALTRDRLRRL